MPDQTTVRLGRRAARQHGLLTRRQALDTGLSDRQIQRRVRKGELIVVERGVYRVAGAPHTWETRVLASCLATDGIASHRTAAAIWGIGDIRRGSPEISVARPARFRRDDVRVHECRDLELAGRRVRDGIPVTGVTRTLIDLGAVLDTTAVDDATVDAVERRLVNWSTVLRVFVQHTGKGRPGVTAMREVIDANLHRAMPQSRFESKLERLLVGAGLPRPVRQQPVLDEQGRIGLVDFTYPEARVLIEADGRAFHIRRKHLTRDGRRRNRLQLAGWLVITVTWEDLVGDPDGIVAEVAASLRVRPAA